MSICLAEKRGGLLDYWIIGLLDYWIIGLLDYWIIGLLDYWIIASWPRGLISF